MTADQIDYHASMMRTQVKKKRKCLSNGCGKIFMSASAGQRKCDYHSRQEKTMGEMGYIAM